MEFSAALPMVLLLQNFPWARICWATLSSQKLVVLGGIRHLKISNSYQVFLPVDVCLDLIDLPFSQRATRRISVVPHHFRPRTSTSRGFQTKDKPLQSLGLCPPFVAFLFPSSHFPNEVGRGWISQVFPRREKGSCFSRVLTNHCPQPLAETQTQSWTSVASAVPDTKPSLNTGCHVPTTRWWHLPTIHLQHTQRNWGCEVRRFALLIPWKMSPRCLNCGLSLLTQELQAPDTRYSVSRRETYSCRHQQQDISF